MGPALPLEAVAPAALMDKKREVPVVQVDTLASPRDDSNVPEASPVSFLRLFRCASSSLLKLVGATHTNRLAASHNTMLQESVLTNRSCCLSNVMQPCKPPGLVPDGSGDVRRCCKW